MAAGINDQELLTGSAFLLHLFAVGLAWNTSTTTDEVALADISGELLVSLAASAGITALLHPYLKKAVRSIEVILPTKMETSVAVSMLAAISWACAALTNR